MHTVNLYLQILKYVWNPVFDLLLVESMDVKPWIPRAQ